MNTASNLACTFLIGGIFGISGSLSYGQKIPLKDYPIQPVNFTKVKVNDRFWANRGAGEMSVWISEAQDTNKTIPPEGSKYTLENCINQFNMNQSTKTAAGYQYWFIDQNFLEDGLTVKMSVVGPKLASHAPHRHAGDEIYYVLEGTAQFYLDGKTATGGANTTFYCPENSEHGISNAGNQELKYLVIRKYPKKEK